MKSYHIEFEPVGRRGMCAAGQSLLECAQQLGVGLSGICGGHGLCGSCRVQILTGSVSEPTSIEQQELSAHELREGYRLACQTYPASDCQLRVPAESMSTSQRTQVEGLELDISPEPAVSAYHLKLQAPSLSDLHGDAEQVLQSLEREHQVSCDAIDIDVLRNISAQLRSWDWQTQASVREQEVIALGLWPSRQLGMAVDLGTTKIAGYLVDLSNGRTLAAEGTMNPQISYGEDIISRVSRITSSTAEGTQMRKLVVEALDRLAADLCAKADAQTQEIVEAVVVGNTAMHHILLGLPVAQLALAPFVPAVRGALDIKARDVGVHIAPGAYVHFLPNIAGFVGADHVAMILATEVARAEGLSLALDIGTNTEVCLAGDGKMTSVSCASGPAFEGGHIKHGMRAASGAIERFRLVDNDVHYLTIDGAPPVGICGSGIVDVLAQLCLDAVLDETGRMTHNHPRVRTHEEQWEFVIASEEERDGHPAITITQKDVRELQLAKAAIQTGIQVLLEAAGRFQEEIEQVTIAGAFGSYIDVSSAIAIGMLPSLPLSRFRQVGNAAGTGARLALISCSKRAESQAVARDAGYIELATVANFMQIFTEALNIGQHTHKGG
ncbi:MAG: DUF4445 domain-containing protein [Dehalococcoidia bacterium]|nr:DUF4445 domain-containing protein [Dehalococcoidia bacterium]